MANVKRYRFTIIQGDRLSALPDELIHKIFYFLDMQVAVQSSVLSKRWKIVWKTLPFLNLGPYGHVESKKTNKFFRKVLSKRNNLAKVSKLSIHIVNKAIPKGLFEKVIEYAMSHGVEDLDITLRHRQYQFKLSTFDSKSLVKLRLYLKLEQSMSESKCWDLPSLTTLDLVGRFKYKFSELYLTSLPALKTLSLKSWDFCESTLSFSLHALTTLCMSWCKLPETLWDFPNLKSLDLSDVLFPDNTRDIFSSFVGLKDLSLLFTNTYIPDHFIISCPELISLNIRTYNTSGGNIVVLAPKLHTFSSLGIISITFGVSELETANIKLRGWINHMNLPKEKFKEYYERFISMFLGLGSVKMLRLELETIEALNKISGFLANFRSPFYNLEYVKLPENYKESIISSAVKSYLLGGSSKAFLLETLCGCPRAIPGDIRAQCHLDCEPLQLHRTASSHKH